MKLPWIISGAAFIVAGLGVSALAQSRDCSWGKPMNPACSPEEIEASGKKFADGHLRWSYTEQPVKLATVYSLNTMIFGPIERNNERRVHLSVAQGDKFQIVSIGAGGILYPAKLTCTAPDCPVSVRFDQGPLQTYSTNSSGGVSMNLLDTKDFVAKVRTSKKVSIVFPFAQYGNVVFMFDISGYKW